MRLALPVLAVLAACSSAASSSASSSGRCDLGSDDGIRAAYHRATGRELPAKKHGLCIERSRTFPVVTVGQFADDRGCMVQGILLGCEFGTGDALQARALAAAGWGRADAARRAALARAWLEEVGGTSMLGEAVPAFAAQGTAFAPPGFETRPDGGVVWRYWTATPHGMTMGAHYRRFETAFGPDGAPAGVKTLAEFDSSR